MTHIQRAPRRRPSRPLPGSQGSEALVLAAFGLAGLTGILTFIAYLLGNDTQVLAVLIAITFGGIGVGLLLWVQELMDAPEAVEERHPMESEKNDAELVDAITDERGITRRKLLWFSLFGALGGLGAAVIGPLFSLGPEPSQSMFAASWRKGSKLVREDGTPVRSGDLDVGGIATVFPDNALRDPNSATILIRLPPSTLLPPANAANAPQNYIALSKVCTHAGCPVGLYRASQQTLICPCHQSTFDVTKGAVPVFGPAVRPLPQLPIQLQPDGTFLATGNYPDPIGPSRWDMYLNRSGQ